jgi:hypothetical protein
MTESGFEFRFEEDLSDESLDRTEAGRSCVFCACSRQ